MIGLENERMRVQARVLLLGRSRMGRLLLAFSVVLRIAVRILAALTVVKAAVLVSFTGGRVMIVLSVVAVAAAFLLCECARTVSDRWYLAVCNGKPVSVSSLILSFSFSDFVFSVKSGVFYRFYSSLRSMAFLAFPFVFAAFVLFVAARGASAAVLSILAAGSLALLLCGAGFAAVSLSCVRLARMLCCYDLKGFGAKLGKLEASASKLLGYSLTLGLFNSAYRRTAELIFASKIL